jgi:predicted O-linked N-acetylglucosamine transferase (SPINDLY family)
MYAPRTDAPGATPLPAEKNGHITFGMFQRTAKLSAECYDLLAHVLQAVPHSRLLLHHTERDFDQPRSRAVRSVVDEFGTRGIEAERLQFTGYRKWADHMMVIAEADIALDTFPFNGQTTTCECLWMGVPVVTLLGRTRAGRVGASLLRQAGLDTWVAQTPEEYVGAAAALAVDLQALVQRRRTLREQVAQSSLCDTAGRTGEIERIYRKLWQRWCEAG